MKEILKQNKENAISFKKMSYEVNPRTDVELNGGSEYIQHNPLVGDGKKPFIKYFERIAAEYPDKSIEFVLSLKVTWWLCILIRFGQTTRNT
jgi:predicted SnoaL-like aldol condensation-catalyzing enzyme